MLRNRRGSELLSAASGMLSLREPELHAKGVLSERRHRPSLAESLWRRCKDHYDRRDQRSDTGH
ncbi:hypothetical protein [Sagittula sp. NFXS13]|uniref:hypothetical protein n=1 Tax=Sagittula sp. NFXS13 TaxID=2819095 RepID=UPI0032E04734